MICESYSGIKLPEHSMKTVERVLQKRLRDIANLDK